MSGRSYSHYMRPQDRDGGNRASGRGRSQHLAPCRGRSRGRERSYDRMSHRRENRDMKGGARCDQCHRSKSSDYAPHSRSHRSRSFDPHHHPTQYNSTHRTKIIRLANAIAHLIIVASTIRKTMSTTDHGAQGASVMVDQTMKDMSVVHSHLPMAIERMCIELQLMNSIEITTPKTMLMHRMVVI
eukprot:scaffold9535_cov160-Skeletonema_marinoi.AAC.10